MEEKMAVRAKRNYKDTLFRMIFKEKDALLSLYNAVSGGNYTDVNNLEIVTLENAIYMNMKNDLAFVIDCSLNLYEHQSTYSPNMPLRNLFYIARELEKLTNEKSLYSSRLVTFPNPEFIVFYNGPDAAWEKKMLRLSDAYERKSITPKLELLVTMLNINPGKNETLFEKCSILFEYMKYVEKVRFYAKKMEISLAVEQAVNESIREGILSELLQTYKAEAVQMSIFEYDEEKEMKLIRQDERQLGVEYGLQKGKAEGKQEGIKEGIKEGHEKAMKFCIEAFVLDNLEENNSEDKIVKKLETRFKLETDEALSWIEKCKKEMKRSE